MTSWHQQRVNARLNLEVPKDFDEWPAEERRALVAEMEKQVDDATSERNRLVASKPDVVVSLDKRVQREKSFLAEVRARVGQ